MVAMIVMVARMLTVASRSIASPSHTQLCSGMVMVVPMELVVKVSLILAASLSDMILECLREERVGACLGQRYHVTLANMTMH